MRVVEKYNRRVENTQSLVCVGLDSRLDKLPERFRHQQFPQFAFNRWIIEQTHSYVSAYKPNMAFYEAYGEQGWHELKLTMDYLHTNYPDIVTICDAKRADIGSTNEGYVAAIFDELDFDAVTLHPFLGKEALMPFLERIDRACIILCRTSNPGADEFQEMIVDGKALWQVVAEHVVHNWNEHGNCMLVVGATAPEQLEQVRQIAGDMILLVPGIGVQGGDLEAVLKTGLDTDQGGLIINSSRGVIFADNPGQAARQFRDAINHYRKRDN